jgi:hypothetical protein
VQYPFNTLDGLIKCAFLRQVSDKRELKLPISHKLGKYTLQYFGLGFAANHSPNREAALEEGLDRPQANIAVGARDEDLGGGRGESGHYCELLNSARYRKRWRSI